jgi:hypothetical protein
MHVRRKEKCCTTIIIIYNSYVYIYVSHVFAGLLLTHCLHFTVYIVFAHAYVIRVHETRRKTVSMARFASLRIHVLHSYICISCIFVVFQPLTNTHSSTHAYHNFERNHTSFPLLPRFTSLSQLRFRVHVT